MVKYHFLFFIYKLKNAMILSEYVKIKISNNQIKYFKEKGYDIKGGRSLCVS